MAPRVCSFSRLPGHYAIVRLAPDSSVPAFVLEASGFASVTRTADELSIVCADGKCSSCTDPFAFDQVGVLASCVTPLAAQGVSVFTISTFDTDNLLIKAQQADAAVTALQAAGHRLELGRARR